MGLHDRGTVTEGGVPGTEYSVPGTGYRVQRLQIVCVEGPIMPGVRSFTDLKCWQEARAWSKAIYQHRRRAPFSDDRRLCVQINDSSESVMANIAEGFGRGTQGEFILFLGYSLGSLDETRSHLVAAYDREFLS